MLIGAELFWKILHMQQIKSTNSPLLQKTSFGWIVAGQINQELTHRTICNLSINNKLEDQIQKFWNIEELQEAHQISSEEQRVEEHFLKTHYRTDEGRFVVRLPFNQSLTALGTSREIALKRLYFMERNFRRDEDLRQRYTNFMSEYIQLGHMVLTTEAEDQPNEQYYLPHFCVIKESSLSTKLRVVFDASSKTSTGISLNDKLLKGPTVQQSLISIVTRFRTHKYALTADIKKMYRQVLVHPEDQELQKVLWRSNDSEHVQTYKLQTVTYGTASAPHLATRCLNQVAIDHKEEFPDESLIVQADFYVDDLLTGANTVQDTMRLRSNITNLLKRGGFELSKWASNDRNILADLNAGEDNIIQIDKNEHIKTLGVAWNSITDTFQFSVQLEDSSKLTKRTILSSISELFDPLGLVSPVIISAKLIMQRLWQSQVSWDEQVCPEIFSTWRKFRNSLEDLNQISVDRLVIDHTNLSLIELHGFADASEKAFGACVYLRSISTENKYTTRLVISKSRLAPLKKITLPRLELCAAVLLSTLVKQVMIDLNINIKNIYLWTDSMITLPWVKSHSRTWKTFVANRVSKIHSHTDEEFWNHISGHENPADLISRGCHPLYLKNSSQWWHGPDWLNLDLSCWPISKERIEINDIPDRKSETLSLIAQDTYPKDYPIFNRFSTLGKLLRVTAYVLRFINNAKKNKIRGLLTLKEIDNALAKLIQLAQGSYSREREFLKRHECVPKNSNLLSLNPFLDNNNILRVGGRLRHSQVTYNKKFPILLPKNHPLTELVIREEHVKQLHAGITGTLSAVRNKFWPISGKSVTKKIIHKCTTCYRCKPRNCNQQLGDLPANRVQPSKPFTNCGVDYCGPIFIKEGIGRSKRVKKTYIAIFVCFSTKAVHIELANDLTTESFIAVLKRFIARRGKLLNIYSDNATNFIGAKNQLEELPKLFADLKHKERVNNHLLLHNVAFHFIPPRSPNFGGLWESAVKSCKHHFLRVTRNQPLTFDETNTLIIQIESILNSRPLCPLSHDPNDLFPLTPAHFLIGESFVSNLDPDYKDIPTNRLTRNQLVQQMFQHFWKRWHLEYLTTLQNRNKWKTKEANLAVNQLVLLKEDNLPPYRWTLGRIIEIHPGPDGLVRVVSVKTGAGVFKRGISKVCVLPID